MPYINFARKYRPQSFEELFGQEAVQKTLKNAIKEGRIAQAYLFAGPRGVGKTSAARILSKALNCEKGPTPDPCNQCPSCGEITSGTSMDVVEIDGASHTQVENVREIRDAVKYLPTRGRYKVYIIDEVHMLSNAAFNALLKTLEEPPPHTVFIMATTEPRKLPLTVISRCQRYEFKPISVELTERKLREVAQQEGVKIDQEAIVLLAMRAEGSLRDALSLLEQAVSFAGGTVNREMVEALLGVLPKERIHRLSEEILKKDTSKILQLVDELYFQGFDIKSIVESLVLHFRNLALFRINPELVKPLPGEREVLESQSRFGDFELFLRLEKEFLRIYEHVSRSSYPRFVLEAELLTITAINPVASAKQILDKLKELTAKFETGYNSGEKKTPDEQRIPAGGINQSSWMDFIEFVKSSNVILSVILKNARFGGEVNNALTLIFPETDKGIVQAQKQEIEDEIKGFFKRELKIDFQWEKRAVVKRPSPEEIKKEAIEDESVRIAMEVFDGKIFDVKLNQD